MSSTKRKETGPDSLNPQLDSPTSKRARFTSSMTHSVSHGRVDPTSGQRSAIPGLDDYSLVDADSDLEYAEDASAIDYLKAVRREAAAIPSLLIAPRDQSADEKDIDRSIYENGLGDTRGFYEDGAYTATRRSESPASPDVVGSIQSRNPQDVYFEVIISHYMALRRITSDIPPQAISANLGVNHPTEMRGRPKDFREWRAILRDHEPKTAQLALMTKDSVLRLLKLIAGDNGFMGPKGINDRASRWVWGLLATLPDRGELISEEISVIRDLGKRAVWIAVRLRGIDLDGLNDAWDEPLDEEIFNETVHYDNTSYDSDLGHSNNTCLATDITHPEIELQMLDSGENVLSANALGETLQAMQENPRSVNGNPSEMASDIVEESVAPSQSNDIQYMDAFLGTDQAVDLESARKRLLSRLDSENGHIATVESAREVVDPTVAATADAGSLANTKATLDMIITVVGEFYGQRDLLEFRDKWD